MAPYAYDSSSNEIWFAIFKRGCINPGGKPTGRKAFKDVINMILLQASTIDRSLVILFWRKALLGLYNYLDFKPL